MKKTKFERATVPPLHEHWNSPPSKEYGDVTDDAVFLAVGRALSTWEEIEVALANMFALFVESYSDAAKRAFGAISSSSGRREALENAAEMFATMQGDDFPKKDFDQILSHIAKASGRRNEIAHGIVTAFELDGKKHGHFLVPASYNSRKTAARTNEWWLKLASDPEDQFMVFGGKYRYTSADIAHFTRLFAILNQQIHGFFMEQMMLYGRKKFNAVPDNQKVSVELGQDSSQ